MSDAVSTWADGTGVWHARVARDTASPLLAARRAIRAELLAREPDCPAHFWRRLVPVRELDTDTTMVWREGLADSEKPGRAE